MLTISNYIPVRKLPKVRPCMSCLCSFQCHKTANLRMKISLAHKDTHQFSLLACFRERVKAGHKLLLKSGNSNHFMPLHSDCRTSNQSYPPFPQLMGDPGEAKARHIDEAEAWQGLKIPLENGKTRPMVQRCTTLYNHEGFQTLCLIICYRACWREAMGQMRSWND